MPPSKDPLLSDSHAVHFYTNQVALGSHVATFLAAGLQRNEAVFVIATRETHDAILRQLSTNRRQTELKPSFTPFDADDLLSAFLVHGTPDHDRFFTVMDQLFEKAAKAGQPIRVYGEMVARLWERGQPDAALQLEELWNLLAERYHFSLLCAYPMRTFEGQNSEWFLNTCATHSQLSIVSGNSFSKTPCLV
jgi:hypothetical protein